MGRFFNPSLKFEEVVSKLKKLNSLQIQIRSLNLNPIFRVLSIVVLLILPTKGFSKTNSGAGLESLTPGALLKQGSSDVLILDKGWRLLWASSGPLQLVNYQGQVLAQASLNQVPQEMGRAEAHGLELEEADLGSGKGGRYLQGKKQPKGRSFQTEKLSNDAGEASEPKLVQQQVQGIPLLTKQFPNGSKILEWHWGKTVESVFLDRRDTMVWVQQEKSLPQGKLSLQQWSDGSFTRRLEKPQGSFAYTWDALSGSSRLVFSNAQKQVIAEFRCDGRSCEQES